MMLALLLAAAPVAPDGTDTARRAESVACYWVNMGTIDEQRMALNRLTWRSWSYWSLYAKGRVRLDVRDRLGWWLGSWVESGQWAPVAHDSVAWRRYGLELEPWLQGELLACAWGQRFYVWGEQFVAWSPLLTAQPFARVEGPVGRSTLEVTCVSSDPGACR